MLLLEDLVDVDGLIFLKLLYTVMLNGVTQVIITKLDVFHVFESVQIATSYQYNGMETQELPFDIVDNHIDPAMDNILVGIRALIISLRSMNRLQKLLIISMNWSVF